MQVKLSLYLKRVYFINMKFWLKIYLANFWQIPQIKFINNDQPVILEQESLEHASFVSLLQLDELKAFIQWRVKYPALNAACQT